ncbi:hypothetical protein EDB85DRAFT_1888745 [Lactarius pseudohatsudake]|nr:hypothetical protein EDB85DRAFT_1888745 [Lactarius pseudohatsudake]
MRPLLQLAFELRWENFPLSIYWHGGVPAVRTRSLAPVSLRLIHSLSHPRSDVPTPSARRVTREGWGSTPRGGDWAGRTDPLASLGVRGCGGPVRRGWTRRPSPLRVQAAGLAWPARRGGRTVPPLAYVGRAHGARQASPAPSRDDVERWGVPSRAPFPRVRVARPRGKGRGWGQRALTGGRRAGATGAVCPRVPPFRANGVVRTGEKGGSGGGGHCAPPFRVNGVAQTWGKGGIPPCAPYLRRTGRRRSMREKEGTGGRVRPGLTLVCPSLRAMGGASACPLASPFDANGVGEWWAKGSGRREEWAEDRGQGPAVLDPAAEVKHACHVSNWACKERRTPTPPTPPSSRSPSPTTRPPHSRRKGMQEGRPMPLPWRAERGARGYGAHGSMPPFPHICATLFTQKGGAQCLPPPDPPFSPVRTTPFARKGGTRGHTAPVAPHPPSPCPRRPIHAERGRTRARCPQPLPFPLGRATLTRGKGAREGTPHLSTSSRLGAGDACLAPRALPTYARGGTVRPPLRAGHASPAACARKGEGRRVHPLHTGYASAAFTHPATPAHPRGCKRVGAPSPAPSARGATPALPGYTPHLRRGACKGEGRTHVKGVHRTRDNATRARAASGGVARRVCGSRRGGAERNPGGGAAHEQKGRHIGARVRKGVNEAK